jgi:hypothetical protein
MADETGRPGEENQGEVPSRRYVPPSEPPSSWAPAAEGLPEVPTVGPPRRRVPVALIVLGVLALAGAATFAVTNLVGGKGGGGTPDGAVQSLLKAVGNEDVLGVLESLLPGERDSLRQSLTDLSGELSRLDILEKSFDLRKIKGLNLDLTNVKLQTTQMAEGFARVKILTGTANFRFAPRELPLGSFSRQLLSDSLGPPRKGSEPVDPADQPFVVAVREGGRWYASLWYTAAEAAREDAGAPAPQLGRGLEARGETSPEKAIERLIRAAAALDVQTLIELLPPDEARVLHDYAPLFLDGAKAAAEELRKLFVIDIRTLDLESKVTGDEAFVTIKRMTFQAGSPDGKLSISFDGECLETAGIDFPIPPRICGSDFNAPGAPPLPRPEIGFVAVERGGAWYFSPTRTALGLVTRLLKAIDRKDLDEIRDFVQGLLGGQAA